MHFKKLFKASLHHEAASVVFFLVLWGRFVYLKKNEDDFSGTLAYKPRLEYNRRLRSIE